MKTYRSARGPFAERPVYTAQEIETICAEELKKVNLFPSTPQVVRIERFIEKRFGVCPEYDDLPEGLLGFTKFGLKGVEKIVVAKDLADAPDRVAERRISTTLAHEAGHGLLHAHLFVVGMESSSLFNADVDHKAAKILCRNDAVSGIQKRSTYDGRWWEFQANQTIGALLLPKSLVEQCLDQIVTTTGSFGIRQLKSENREQAVKLLSDVFDVNPIVARIRAEQLYPQQQETQLTL